jgi:copper chaperone CopZ
MKMEILKKRDVAVEGMKCSGCEGIVEEELKKMKGIRSVKADHDKNQVSLEYNLLNVTLEEIDGRLKQLNYKLPTDVLEMQQRQNIYSAERNERERFVEENLFICRSCPSAGCYGNKK